MLFINIQTFEWNAPFPHNWLKIKISDVIVMIINMHKLATKWSLTSLFICIEIGWPLSKIAEIAADSSAICLSQKLFYMTT